MESEKKRPAYLSFHRSVIEKITRYQKSNDSLVLLQKLLEHTTHFVEKKSFEPEELNLVIKEIITDLETLGTNRKTDNYDEYIVKFKSLITNIPDKPE